MTDAAATSIARRLRQHAAGLRRRPLVRDGLWVAAGHATTAVSGLVSIRLFTELAPQSVFGAANLLIGMLTLGMHALLAPITQTQIRYHTAYSDAGDGDAYTRLMARLAAGAAAGIIALVTLVLLLWPEARAGAGVGVIGWLAAWVAVSTCRNVLIARVQAERKQRRYALWLGTEALLTLACTGATLALWPTVQGFVAGQLAGVAIAAAAFGLPTVRWHTTERGTLARLRPAACRQIMDYGLAFLPFAILGWLSNLSDRYILVAYLDTAAVGQYVAAFAIASRLPTLVGALMNDVVRPALFEAENRGERVRAQRLFSGWIIAIAGSATLMVLLLFTFGDQIATLLLAEGYRGQAREMMCWVAAGYGCLAIAQVIENRLLSFGISRRLIWTKPMGATANVAFALIFIPWMGPVGAARANAAGQTVLLLTSALALLSRRSYRVPRSSRWSAIGDARRLD